MQIIGVVARKGGAGKTTTAVHLAGELTSRGRSVELVDCDLQGSATHWAELGALPFPVHRMPIEREADVPSWSARVRALQAELVILDAPPHLDAASGAVIGMADVVLIPCGPTGLDLMATAETVSLVREVREHRGGSVPRILLVPNRVDRRTASGRELQAALRDLKEVVAPPVGYRTAFADSFNVGQWVGVYAPRSFAHMEASALADVVLKALKVKP